jgi:hypothetical protein
MDSLTTLTRLGGGKFLDAISEHLAAVAADVVRTGKKGSVVATITVEQFEAEPEVIVTATVQPKPPSEKPQAAIFFALDGELHREDPRQPRLDFRVVNETTGEIRHVADAPDVREAE